MTNFDIDDEILTAAFDMPNPVAHSGKEWEEVQHARAEYIKEWEEDMRYAQELAQQGM
jgi:hypothetical protein